MFQQIVPQEQVPAPLSQVTPESFTATMSVVMAVWASVWVLSQVIKVFKGEEIERPLILK